jgi:hypothetical protein
LTLLRPPSKSHKRGVTQSGAVTFIEKTREIEADEKHSAADKLMEGWQKMKPGRKGTDK